MSNEIFVFFCRNSRNIFNDDLYCTQEVILVLEMDIDVVKGIMFIHLEGDLNRDTIGQFDNELNYLLYKQGMHYFVFDFKDLNKIDYNVISWLEEKVMEIILNCGKVVIQGFGERYGKKIYKHFL